MVSTVRPLVVALIAGSLSSLLSAAPPTPPGKAPDAFDETIDVRVVNVEAVVTDRSGERVSGLGPRDLRLLVDGREVPVEYFTEVTEGMAGVGGGGRGAAPPPGAADRVGRSYLVFVDDSFSIAGARDAVLSQLAADLVRLRPEDRMAVLAFDGNRIDVLSAWTGDRPALAAALAAARQRPTNGAQRIAQDRDMDADIEIAAAAGGDFAVSFLIERVSPEARTQLGRTAPAIAAALRGFAAPPGRKVMFLISGGWSLFVAPQLFRPVVTAANQLGYTLYPVDTATPTLWSLKALDALAAATGGKVVTAGLRQGAFEAVLDDSGSYYWLGFAPVWKENGRPHSIRVEARRSDLRVRARNGFTDPSPRVTTAQRAESVLLFGGRSEDRRLVIELGAPRRTGRGKIEVPVTLGVPLEALLLTPAGSGYAAEAPLSVAALDAHGGRADLPESRLRLTIAQLPPPGGLARFRTVLQLRKAPQRLVLTVADAVDGGVLWGETKVDFDEVP